MLIKDRNDVTTNTQNVGGNIKSNNIKKIFKYIGGAIAILAFAYLFFYVTFNAVSPNLTVKKIGYKNYVILSESMEPELRKGDLIMVVKRDFNQLKEGDIVTFTNPNDRKAVVTHNFVRYENYNGELIIRTKGNQSSDGGEPQIDFWKISEQDFIGVYKYRIPKIGNVVAFLQSWYGFLSIVLICFVIAGAYYAVAYYYRKDSEEDTTDLDNKQS